jgi:uncharacterized protein YjiS (DUF1127 family)
MATTATQCLTQSQPDANHSSSWSLPNLMQRVADWGARRVEREVYAHMTDRDVQDMGVSRWEIERELARPFYRD